MRKILLTAFAAALSVSSASADEFVVKTSSNGALTAGQVLDNTGTAIVVKSNFAATKNKDTKKGVFPDGLAASYFSVASSKMRLPPLLMSLLLQVQSNPAIPPLRLSSTRNLIH